MGAHAATPSDRSLLPGHGGHVSFSFSPQIATYRLARKIQRRVASFLHCGRRAIDARAIEAVGTCGALWDVGTCGARSELRLISREAGILPPWLLSSRCSYG
jgi:hypothetical protein